MSQSGTANGMRLQRTQSENIAEGRGVPNPTAESIFDGTGHCEWTPEAWTDSAQVHGGRAARRTDGEQLEETQ